MVTIEFQDKNDYLINEITTLFPEVEVLNIHSFGAEEIVQIIIPIVAIVSPTAAVIITKILESKKVILKYDNIEVSGDYKHVFSLFDDLLKRQESKDAKHI